MLIPVPVAVLVVAFVVSFACSFAGLLLAFVQVRRKVIDDLAGAASVLGDADDALGQVIDRAHAIQASTRVTLGGHHDTTVAFRARDAELAAEFERDSVGLGGDDLRRLQAAHVAEREGLRARYEADSARYLEEGRRLQTEGTPAPGRADAAPQPGRELGDVLRARVSELSSALHGLWLTGLGLAIGALASIAALPVN